MRARALIPSLLLVVVLLAACGSDDDGSSSPGPSTDPAALTGVVWTLDGETMGALAEDPAEAQVTLEFTDGQVSGTAGCNTYSGSYQADDEGGLTFGPLSTTLMACDEALMALEGSYLETLAQVTNFGIEGDLILQANNVQMSFAPQ